MLLLQDLNEQANGTAGPLFFVPGTNQVIPELMAITHSRSVGFIDFKNADRTFVEWMCSFGVCAITRPCVVWWQNTVHFETSCYSPVPRPRAPRPPPDPTAGPVPSVNGVAAVPASQCPPAPPPSGAGLGLWRATKYSEKVPPGTVAWRCCIGLHSPDSRAVAKEHLTQYSKIRRKGFKIWSFLANAKHPLVVDAYSQQFAKYYDMTDAQRRHMEARHSTDDTAAGTEYTDVQRWLLGDRSVDICAALGPRFARVFAALGSTPPPATSEAVGVLPPGTACRTPDLRSLSTSSNSSSDFES
uniref:Uncharacterized protein n=1 Tax=Eutreptiella gymnastica TaxID=73025 RepID=A0A7S1JIE8_9EUGL